MNDQTNIENYAEKNLKNNLKYFSLQSVSAQNRGIQETVNYLTERFKALGAAEIQIYDSYQNPAIYACFKGKSNKTILFYNHYDVQPTDPEDAWKTDPFDPTIKDGKLYGRGVCDDKGELASRLGIVQYFNEHGGLPCTLKFFVEGEEEIGSPDIEKYVQNATDKLQCDAAVWEGGGRNEGEQFQLLAGVKGIASFDAEVTTAEKDVHSSLAPYIENAAWRLIQGLTSLYGADHKIKIDHFYDDVKPLSDYDAQVIKDEEPFFNQENVIETFGIKSGHLKADQPYYASMNEPTITINGLSAGYTDDGIKTIIPHHASAKLDCRLVPNQDPQKIVELIQAQLKQNGFNDIQVKYNLGEDAFRTDLKSPFVQQCYQIATEMFGNGQAVLVPNMPGGGPMAVFYQATEAPVLGFGIHYAGSTPHAPNENIRIKDYREGSAFLAKVITEFGASDDSK